MSDRIAELESRFTHQERMLADLSDVVWKQQQELDTLKGALLLLERKVGADPGLVDARDDEKPPHY